MDLPFPFILLAFQAITLSDGAIVGVPPEEQHKYVAGERFFCLDMLKIVPFTSVNDNFCDCADGSDEPGTGACAGIETTLFHCPNIGSTQQLVYLSRVDDGICDCCDGSDEAGLAARKVAEACPNRCEAEGIRERAERAERMEILKKGLSKKEQVKGKAIEDRKQWEAEIQQLKALLPDLETGLATAQAAAKAAEPEKEETAAEGTDLKTEVDSLKEKVDKHQEEIDALRKDVDSIKAEASEPADTKPDEGAEAKQAKPVVSEYAKWMDGAGDTPGAIDEGAAQEDHEAQGPYEGDDDNGEDASEHPTMDEGDDDLDSPTKPVEGGTSAPEKNSEVEEAEQKVKTNKAETKKLQKKIDQISEDQLGYASLAGECLSKHDGQYEWKICFFDDANQDHVSLGKWSGFTSKKTAKFKNGQMCPGGPARDLKVIFECGDGETIKMITEPSRCSYEAVVEHPGACDEEDAAVLEKPPVRHPRDEL